MTIKAAAIPSPFPFPVVGPPPFPVGRPADAAHIPSAGNTASNAAHETTETPAQAALKEAASGDAQAVRKLVLAAQADAQSAKSVPPPGTGKALNVRA